MNNELNIDVYVCTSVSNGSYLQAEADDMNEDGPLLPLSVHFRGSSRVFRFHQVN